MKIHTHNVDKVKGILDSIIIPDENGGHPIKYKLIKNYFKFQDLSNEHYFDLPEFRWSDNLNQRKCFKVDVKTDLEKEILFKSFGVKPTKKTFFYYELNPHPMEGFEYSYSHKITPKYPIYVITKGRWDKTLTIDTLEDMGVDFFICVEPKEIDMYLGNPKVDPQKVLILPENFSERGEGAVPVRNWVWEHSIQMGFEKHWQLDDNIHWFYRWNNNIQKKIRDGVFFRIMEDFSDRYENIGLVSPQYKSFIPAIDTGRGQFLVNTRAYSCILINNTLLDQRLTERWRGRYNDDTDLTLRVLSTGDLCTVNFHSLLSGKQTSGSMKGGMQDMYKNHTHLGYQKKFDSLKEQWGDIVKLTNRRHKDGRPHHIIEYTDLFTQKLILKEGISREPRINEYNMIFSKKYLVG
jgi:hypothetical protein